MAELCKFLEACSTKMDGEWDWPSETLDRCAGAGVFAWFHSIEDGGMGWSESDLCRGYMKLARACMTTTFVITQRVAACRRIAGADDPTLRDRFLPKLIRGEGFATIGISHLTTSRRHLDKPVLQAAPIAGGYRLNGMSPWVTGSTRADLFVIGAELEDGRQILAVVPADVAGVATPTPANLSALSSSQTGPIEFHDVIVPHADLIRGPIEDVMQQSTGGATGGLQTSSLAFGLADAAISYLEAQSQRRENLALPAQHLREQWSADTELMLKAAAAGTVADNARIRQHANSLVLRTTQAALAAAKGTGYLWGHPAGRWCREAMFFLVWSCPQEVADANLCELAQTTP